MPTIDKVSSLRNYQAVLDKVQPGNPVFLTKNGVGRYAIVDTAEYDFLYKAAFGEFFEQLDAARAQADRDGWISEDALRERFGITADAQARIRLKSSQGECFAYWGPDRNGNMVEVFMSSEDEVVFHAMKLSKTIELLIDKGAR